MRKFCFLLVTIVIFFSCNNSTNKTEKKEISDLEINNFIKSDLNMTLIDTMMSDYAKIRFTKSFILIKNNKVLVEKYFNNTTRDSLIDVTSICGTVMSSLIGKAIELKYITGTDQKISDFFPEIYSKLDDKRKRDITIKHILTQTSGLDKKTANPSDDWIFDRLSSILIDAPGKSFFKSPYAPQSHILSGIITNATHTNTFDFARKYIFEPLEITNVKWDKSRNGLYIGGTGLYLIPLDIAKFGNLYLNKGVYKDQQIISQEWVAHSLENYREIEKISYPGLENAGFGFQWWIFKPKYDNVLLYHSIGYGGQEIIIIPKLNITIAIVASISIKDPEYLTKINKLVNCNDKLVQGLFELLR